MIEQVDMRAIVLAAGLGKRMRPLTDDKPKPLVNVGGKALIDHALDWLVAAGVREAVVNTHYKAEMLQAHLHTRLHPHIVFSHEPMLLETGGGIYKALPLLGKAPFFALNSDTICINGKQHALARLAQHWNADMDALLLLQPVEKAVGYEGQGDFYCTVDGEVARKHPGENAPYVFTGIQIIHPRLFTNAPTAAFSLNLLYNRDMGRIHALVHDGIWLHVGEPQSIALAEAYL